MNDVGRHAGGGRTQGPPLPPQPVPFPEPLRTALLLVFPPFQRLVVSMENIGIEYIASYARSRGFSAAIVNAGLHGLTVDDIVRVIRQSSFRVLGISTIHWNLQAALEIAMAAKFHDPDCHVILGGIEAALDADRLLATHPFLDSVCLGEGERIVAELLCALSRDRDWRQIKGIAYRGRGGVVRNEAAELIAPLDQLPFPARDDLAAVRDSGGPVSIGSSRGCFGSCSFCSVRAFYNLSKGSCWRGRSPASVVEELRDLAENRGVALFSFVDETVAGPGQNGAERLRDIARLIRDSGLRIEFFMTIRADQVEEGLFRELRLAGLKKVEIGIESMAESQLRRYGKTCRVEDNRRALRILDDLGILSEVFMIPYDAGTSFAELSENLAFYAERFSSRGERYDVAALTMGDYLYPYPGTGARAVYRDKGWLGAGSYASFHAEDAAIQTVQQTVKQFIFAIESAFPLSYAGVGNLWVNSRGLPATIHGAICRIAAGVGELLIDVTRWSHAAASDATPLSDAATRELGAALRDFVARAAQLRDELKQILLEVGSRGDEVTPQQDSEACATFARQLHLYGRSRREALVAGMYSDSFDGEEMIAPLLDLIRQARGEA